MKTLPTKPATINTQNEGPLFRSPAWETGGDLTLRNRDGFIVARVNQYAASFGDKRDEANAHLLAKAYTAFDKAGRSLKIDAAQLAEQIDIAACVEFALCHFSIAQIYPLNYPLKTHDLLQRAVGGMTARVERYDLPL